MLSVSNVVTSMLTLNWFAWLMTSHLKAYLSSEWGKVSVIYSSFHENWSAPKSLLTFYYATIRRGSKIIHGLLLVRLKHEQLFLGGRIEEAAFNVHSDVWRPHNSFFFSNCWTVAVADKMKHPWSIGRKLSADAFSHQVRTILTFTAVRLLSLTKQVAIILIMVPLHAQHPQTLQSSFPCKNYFDILEFHRIPHLPETLESTPVNTAFDNFSFHTSHMCFFTQFSISAWMRAVSSTRERQGSILLVNSIVILFFCLFVCFYHRMRKGNHYRKKKLN